MFKDFEIKKCLSLFGHPFLCLCYLMTTFYYLSRHPCFCSPFLSQRKIPNFCSWFLWKAPWQKIRNGLLLQNNQIVKQGNFVTGIKIFTRNNLIISIVLMWHLPIGFDVFTIIIFVNDSSSVTVFYMVLMLHIWLHRKSFSRIWGIKNS